MTLAQQAVDLWKKKEERTIFAAIFAVEAKPVLTRPSRGEARYVFTDGSIVGVSGRGPDQTVWFLERTNA